MQHNEEIKQTNNTGNLYTYVDKIVGNTLPPKKRDYHLDLLKNAVHLNYDDMDELEDDVAAERSHFDYITLCNGKSMQVG
jgi:hypothetical protein